MTMLISDSDQSDNRYRYNWCKTYLFPVQGSDHLVFYESFIGEHEFWWLCQQNTKPLKQRDVVLHMDVSVF